MTPLPVSCQKKAAPHAGLFFLLSDGKPGNVEARALRRTYISGGNSGSAVPGPCDAHIFPEEI